jgi:hypothetical protein
VKVVTQDLKGMMVKQGYLVIKVIRVMWDLQDLKVSMDPKVQMVNQANKVLLESKGMTERKEVEVSTAIRVIRDLKDLPDLKVSDGISYEVAKLKIFTSS